MQEGGKKDPYRNFRYLVEIEGIVQAGFSEATILDSTKDVIKYRTGNEPPYVRKVPSLSRYGVLTLKRGISDSIELVKWLKLVEQGKKDPRRNVVVILMDEKGNPAARWEFGGAWVSKYDAPDLTAEGNDVAIETLEITFETMERVQ